MSRKHVLLSVLVFLVLVLASQVQGAIKAGFTVQIVDTADNPIAQVVAGQQFKAKVYVQDLRGLGATGGVFSAFADLTYDLDYMDWVVTGSPTPAPQPTIQVAPFFANFLSGTIDEPNRLVDEAGGMGGFTPPGDAMQLLFTITGEVPLSNTGPLTAVTFAANPAEGATLDLSLYGLGTALDRINEATYGTAQLMVPTPEPGTLGLLAFGVLMGLSRRRKTGCQSA